MKTILLGATLMLGACASFPPSSISAGFMGANVTWATPGWAAQPVPVVKSSALPTTTLFVPANSPAADHPTAVVTGANGSATVPVVVAPVAAPTLEVSTVAK